ncbi:MAG: methyl-accepting chemotaxis protein [Acidimicrobiia bacterium]
MTIDVSVGAEGGVFVALRRTSISVRLWALAALAIGVFAVCTAIGGIRFTQVRHQSAGAAANVADAATLNRARAAWLTVDDQSNMFTALILLQDPAQQALADATWKQVTEARADLDSALETLKALSDSSLRDEIASLETSVRTYLAFTDRVEQAAQAGQPQAALRIMTIENADASNAADAAFDALATAFDEQSDASLAAVNDNAQNGRLLLIAISIAAAIVLVALFSAVLRSILKPLTGLRDRLTDIAQGDADLTVRLSEAGQDELTAISGRMNEFVERVRVLVAHVASEIDSVARASEEMSTMATTLTEGATVNAGLAGEAAGTADDVAANVAMVRHASDQLRLSIEEIATAANGASNVAEDAVARTEQAKTMVEALAASATQINDVLALINSIAEQTNLLALNATIEAARAGESGRGFAVVAHEVKQLAGQTANATLSVGTTIRTVIDDTARATDAIRAIAAVMGEVNHNQMRIASAVDEQTATTAEIVDTVSRAASGVDSIASSVGTVAQAATVTQTTALGASTAADELAQRAVNLNALVGAFRY